MWADHVAVPGAVRGILDLHVGHRRCLHRGDRDTDAMRAAPVKPMERRSIGRTATCFPTWCARCDAVCVGIPARGEDRAGDPARGDRRPSRLIVVVVSNSSSRIDRATVGF
jgi:hypothetical protein